MPVVFLHCAQSSKSVSLLFEDEVNVDVAAGLLQAVKHTRD